MINNYTGILLIGILIFSPSAWWKFAIDCHLRPIRERNERRTKGFILQRVTDIILYTKAYTEHLTNPVIGPETLVFTLLNINNNYMFSLISLFISLCDLVSYWARNTENYRFNWFAISCCHYYYCRLNSEN